MLDQSAVDPELERVTQLLSTDDELVSYIRKLVLSRLTVDTLADKKWMKAVVDFSVEEAMKKLEIDRMIMDARFAVETEQNSFLKETEVVGLKPSFSESEPLTSKPRKTKVPRNRSTKTAPTPLPVAAPNSIPAAPISTTTPIPIPSIVSTPFQTYTDKDVAEESFSPMKPVTAASVGSYTSRRNFTISPSAYDDSASPSVKSSESPKKKGILMDDDVLMDSAPEDTSAVESNTQSFDVSPLGSESPPRTDDLLGDSLSCDNEDDKPDEGAADVESDDDTVPVYGGTDVGDNLDLDIALNDSDDSDSSRHVRFSSDLENVRYIENVHSGMESEEKEKLFFTHIEGNRSNYCYQKQKDKASEDGYDNWNEYISAKDDAELEAEDEQFSRDFDYLLENRYNHIWGDEESDSENESDDNYAYMYNNIDDGDDDDSDRYGSGNFDNGDGDNLRRTVDFGTTLHRGMFPRDTMNTTEQENEQQESDAEEVEDKLDCVDDDEEDDAEVEEVHEAVDDDWE